MHVLFLVAAPAALAGLEGPSDVRRWGGPPPQIELGLVGWWGFEEGAGTFAADGSPNALHGTIQGAQWIDGRFGSALRFDGGDWVQIADAPELRITEDITIAAWVRKDSPNNGLRWDAILAKASSTAWDYELLTSKAQSDEPAFYSDLAAPDEVYAGEPLRSDVWKHVAVTRAGADVTFYVDGVELATETMAGAFASTAKPLRIGHDVVEGMIGDLDEVRLYDRALTPSEIAVLADDDGLLDPARIQIAFEPAPLADGHFERVQVTLPAWLGDDVTVRLLVRPGPAPDGAPEDRWDTLRGWTPVAPDAIGYRALRRYAGQTFTLCVAAIDREGRVALSDFGEVRFQR